MSEKQHKKYESKHWIGCPTEEEFFGTERKAGKQQRKRAMDKDRSKYKKSDRDKIKTEGLHKNIKLDAADLLRGRVLAITPESIVVDCDGVIYQCTLRGLLKKERSSMKNLVTVGDFVLLEKDKSSIAHVEPRQTVLSRADNLSRRKEQLIAANIDLVIITGSVVSPPIKPSLLDRYIIAAYKGKLQPLIVINKIDLLTDEKYDEVVREVDRYLIEELKEAYAQTDIPLIAVSTTTGEGLDLLRNAMKGKATVFSGQSGVGKSSLINALTGLNLRIGDVVDKTQKGSHTTTSAQLVPLEFGGWCIDTPGIKSFGIWDLKREEIVGYFQEIDALGRQCHFPNCSHTHEEGCAVIAALEEEKLSAMRYDSYRLLIESVSSQHTRR